MMESNCSRFTPAEGGARLAAAASERNILAVEYPAFIATRLVYEHAYKIRGSLFDGSQRSVHIARASRVPSIAYDYRTLTDLDIAHAVAYEDVYDWCAELDKKEVVVCTSSVLKRILEEYIIKISNLNVLIIESCHLIYKDDNLKYILKHYKETEEDNRPRILALTYPLFLSKKKDDLETIDNTRNTKDDDQSNKQDFKEIKSEKLDDNDETLSSSKEKSDDASDLDDENLPIDNDEKPEEVIEKKNNSEKFGVYENLDDFDMYEKLEWKIEELEKEICCQMDLAEDIDGGKRLSATLAKPTELIIEYRCRGPSLPEPYVELEAYMRDTVAHAVDFLDDHRCRGPERPEPYVELETYMRDTVAHAVDFLDDHRFDLIEMYGEDFIDELKNVPDPTEVPKNFLNQFLYVLEQLGPYAADKLAFNLLIKLEKLRVREKYDRHFLLLCLITTTFIKIRCYTDSVFEKYSDWDKIQLFSTPKLMRFVEILEKFQPNEAKNEKNVIDATKLLNDIDNCDFMSLSNKIEDRVNTYEANLKDLDEKTSESEIKIENKSENSENKSENSEKKSENSENKSENSENKSENSENKKENSENKSENSENKSEQVSANSEQVIANSEKVEEDKCNMWFPRKGGGRARGRGRTPRVNTRVQQALVNPDALCGIVFMKEALMAKTMFLVVVDMSRCNPKLSYLCAQYCAVDDTPDHDRQQGKRHETVLKKFRMHECNLLLATSELEEGIDLPRCNLVLRWDVPASYRSYGLSRGRARAARAASALLCCGPLTCTLLHNVATYRELDQIISRKCGCGVQNEPPPSEEEHADALTCIVKPYSPQDCDNTIKNNTNFSQKVNLNNDSVAKFDDRSPKTNFNDNKTIDIDENANNDIKNDDLKNINDGARLNNEETNANSDEFNLNLNDKIDNINVASKSSEGRSVCDINKTSNIEDRVINEFDNKASIDNKNNIDTLAAMKEIKGENGSQSDINGKSIILDTSKENTEVGKRTNFDTNIANQKNDNTTNENVNDVNKSMSQLGISEVLSINQEGRSNIDVEVSNSDFDDKNNDQDKKYGDVKTSSVRTNVSSGNISAKVNIGVSDANVVDSDVPNVDLSTAIPLINRYCAKLPSDTFTRLAPQWWSEQVQLPDHTGALHTAYICTLRLPLNCPVKYNIVVQLPDHTGALHTAYICTLRLPLNCPVKYNIVGHPMKTRVLARRMVALQACRILHKSGELDDHLMPIGKENFKAAEFDCSNLNSDSGDPSDAARPGTTKRRQYYYKRTAWAFTDCQPIIDTTDAEIEANPTKPPESDEDMAKKQGIKRNVLYALSSRLSCALPERYNTRGRRLHAPQLARHAVGLLMAREHTDDIQIPAFPVYTRSGELLVSVKHVPQADTRVSPTRCRLVRRYRPFPVYTRLGELLVSVRHIPQADTRVSPTRCRLVRRFMRFVFAEVLRVHRRGMKLQTDGSKHNNYYVVPTVKTINEDGNTSIDIDWPFLQLIYDHTEAKKHAEIEKPILFPEGDTTEGKKEGVKKMDNPLLKPGETFVFDPENYKEAVVTPWYRNQDQPQFFLVAEICWNLTPDSAFPSASHSSFRKYYSNKYGVTLTQANQPLLDVDHTSARLNLLTPRYVNRKGVALPVSSERTRRAKRDRLDQKQILLPELCTVHPFAAPLWFATVALPCMLYRINALLIADEIRRAVAIDVGLGIPKIDEKTCPGFSWPPLDFGWSLAEVLNADEKSEKKKEEECEKIEETKELEDSKSVEEKETEVADETDEQKEKTVNDILQEKENAESSFEIGTWSNEMAYNIPERTEYDDLMEPLPSNVTLVTSESGGVNWTEKPRQYNPPKAFSVADSDDSYMSSDFDTDTDSDESYDGDSGFGTGKINMTPSSFRIEYKTAHEAEAFDVERKKVNPAPTDDPIDDELDRREHQLCIREGIAPKEHIDQFRKSVDKHKKDIIQNGNLIDSDRPVTEILPELAKDKHTTNTETRAKSELVQEMFPYKNDQLKFTDNGQICLKSIEANKRMLLAELKKSMTVDEIKKMKCFSMVDVDIDSESYVNEKLINVGFDTKEMYEKKISQWDSVGEFKPYYQEGKAQNGKDFDFDYQPKLEGHPGPSPSLILQALTMSNANDGINLERLETIGDSFLKFAITAYLYCAHPTVHEGKLSHMRSKQVSNLNLYRLGRNKRLGARMIASKFEPHDNWLPPCHKPPPTLHPKANEDSEQTPVSSIAQDSSGCFIPYNLITQHSIPDKSIADCVEALIGAYLLECGPRGALLFMSWLGIRVLPAHELPLPADHGYISNSGQKPSPKKEQPSPRRSPQDSSDSDSAGEQTETQTQDSLPENWSWPGRPVGSLRPHQDENGRWMQQIFGELKAPPSPLLRYIEDPEGELEQMLSGYDALERTLQYRFRDRSLLLQALTHASHHNNRLTDCYQRLEFLGDAILDYLITRHLYEEPRRHSPGALTDLRSALVNNTIFATLAARHGFHKYFRHMSPGLNEVLTKYVKIQEENGHSISEEHYLIQEDEMEQAEDVEVPKALGDLFESVAGAIFLDSGMSLGAVWKSYVNLMGAELEAFSAAAPKSPVRELLEAEPDTAKFGKPERLADGRRVRVSVEVFGRGTFKGIGRNYRIAKGTAARCALRHLRLLHKGH